MANGLITVRIIARGDGPERAAQAAEATVQTVRQRLGDLAFGADDDTMAGVIGAALRAPRGEPVRGREAAPAGCWANC